MYIQNLPKSKGKTQFPIRPDRPDFSFNTHQVGKYRYTYIKPSTIKPPVPCPPQKTDFSLSFSVTYTCRRLGPLGTCSKLPGYLSIEQQSTNMPAVCLPRH